MAEIKEALVPDIGDYSDIPVIEVLVAVGDTVKKDQGLVTLESDKATMEVPSAHAGVVKELKVKVGDNLSEGKVVALIEVAEGEAEPAAPAAKAAAPAPASKVETAETAAVVEPVAVAAEPDKLIEQLKADPAVMAASRKQLLVENGDIRSTAVLIDSIEASFGDGADGYSWGAQGWTGGDINRFWWKTEGEGEINGTLHEAEVQALYSRAIAPFWDVQAGVRQDFRPDGDDTTHLTVGIQGVAPYWFEMSAAAFLSTEGDLTARAEAEYDQRITQKLILQPRLEIEASASDIPELRLASGLTHVSAGMRLRYEFKKEFAPYVGVEWSSDLGGTADLTRAMGGEPEHTRVVVGVRAWF